jgi:thioesterase domain-containing protein
MMVRSFLEELRRRGIQVSADGDRLRCTAPPGVLSPELREQLKQRKADILSFLRSGEALAQQPRAIVPLQPHGARTPVFAVGGHNGDVFCYSAFVKQLEPDQPFFGLQPPGLDGQSEPMTRVEDLAGYFADQVRAFRPAGPYIVVGFCAGGGVAFELARQLEQGGAVVSLLGLFGSPFPTGYRLLGRLRQQVRLQVDRFRRHAHALAIHSLGDLRRYVAEKRQYRKVNSDAAAAAAHDPILALRGKVERATIAALGRYTPGPLAAPVAMFLPSRAWLRYGTAGLGWRSVAANTGEFVGPDGCDGDNMLRDHAPRFAEAFRRFRDARDGPSMTAGAQALHRLLATSPSH